MSSIHVALSLTNHCGINIYCPGVEDSFDATPAMRTEMDWLIICKDGTV